eukprot:3932269-Rhodomonas_salina.1
MINRPLTNSRLQELGGAPSDMYECDFYCDLFAAVRSELRGACSSDAHCRAGAPPTHYSLQPSSAAVLCAEQAKYACTPAVRCRCPSRRPLRPTWTASSPH